MTDNGEMTTPDGRRVFINPANGALRAYHEQAPGPGEALCGTFWGSHGEPHSMPTFRMD